MKKSITVLGIEADGIRGVRLEESGTDWNCVDSGFWPIGGSAAHSTNAPYQKDGDGGAASPHVAEDDTPLFSADDRYAAMVESLKDASKRFGANEVVLSMPTRLVY